MLLSTGPPFCLHILHCPSKGLSRNWAYFWNLRCEYRLNHWSDVSEINCDGFSFKSPLIWYTSFSQRLRAIFGCCIANIKIIPQFDMSNGCLWSDQTYLYIFFCCCKQIWQNGVHHTNEITVKVTGDLWCNASREHRSCMVRGVFYSAAPLCSLKLRSI